MELDQITYSVIGAAILVHRALGLGLMESAYEECTAYELKSRGFFIERQKQIPLVYKGVKLDCCYRADMIVEKQVIVEFKCAAQIIPVHEAQMITYLKLTELPVGLILNFHAPVLKDGIKRLVNNFTPRASASPRLGG